MNLTKAGCLLIYQIEKVSAKYTWTLKRNEKIYCGRRVSSYHLFETEGAALHTPMYYILIACSLTVTLIIEMKIMVGISKFFS